MNTRGLPVRAGLARCARFLAGGLMASVVLYACASAPIGNGMPGSLIPSGTAAASLGASLGTIAPPPATPGSPGPQSITHVTASTTVFRLPTALSRAVAFPDGNGLLVCGGLTRTSTTAAVVRIDLGSGSATHVGDLAAPVHDAAGAALAGSMILFGGGGAVAEAAVQRVTTSGSSAVIGSLPIARADEAAATVGNDVVVLGGGLNGVVDRAVLATTDGVHFTTIATLPVGVRYAAAAALGGTVYLFGGAASAGDVATIQAVDVASGRARRVADLPQTMSHAMAFVIDGRIYLAGGRHAGRALDTILAFDPTTGRTTDLGRLPQAMSDAAVAVVGTTAYLIGGEASSVLDSILVLLPG